MAIGLTKLVTHVGRDTGLDPPGAQGDEIEAGHHPTLGTHARAAHERECEMPETVHQGQAEIGAVLPEEPVGENGSQDRRDVHQPREIVIARNRLCVLHRRPRGIRHEEEVLGHKNREDGLHAVEAEALRGLIPNDVGNPFGQVAWPRGGQMGALTHDVHLQNVRHHTDALTRLQGE